MPNYKIQRNKTFSYIPENRTIHYTDLRDYYDLFGLLHEFGHAHFQHLGLKTMLREKEPFRVWQQEIDAWKYARKCIRSNWYWLFDSFAVDCLDTYNRFLTCYSRSELLNLITGATRQIKIRKEVK